MQLIFSFLILVFAFFGFIHLIKTFIIHFKDYIEKLRAEKYGSNTTNTADADNSEDVNY